MKNFKRIVAIVLALTCALALFTACQKAEPEVAPKIYAISGPTGVGMVNLMEDYDITLSSAPEEVVGKVANGEANIATVPGSKNVVEFAVKLPGDDGESVYLPIDS